MKFRNILLVSAAVLVCTAAISASTIAHTWVSGSGHDTNPCTFVSPCATFAGALTNTTAGGMITAKDAGDFGPFSIGQSVTIDGNNLGSITFNNSVNSGIGIYGGANVTIQNLTINGVGSGANGISSDGAGTVTINHCKIMNITSDGIDYGGPGTLTVENSRIESFIGGQVWGIEVEPGGTQNILVKNTVIDASASSANEGISINEGSGSLTISLQNVTITGAGNYAIEALAGITEITGSVITQSKSGLYVSQGATVSVASSLITNNTTGVCSGPSSKVRLDNNDIYDNITAIGNCGGTVKTSGTNKTSGTISIPASDVSDSVTF